MKHPYLIGLLLPLQLLVAQPVEAKSCTSYRLNYESAIAQGLMERPSLVRGARQSWHLFRSAMARNDRIEAAARAAQFLVIIAEGEGTARADLAHADIKQEIRDYYQQPAEAAVPMLVVILANNPTDCPLRIAQER